MSEQKIVAVIPAYDEEETISSVIGGAKGFVDEIVVVDDASTDGTAAAALRAGAVVISHSKNLGYDKSIDDGFALAAQENATIIVTLDGDGQHEPRDISKLVEPIIEGQADVVVGKRPRRARTAETLFALVAKARLHIDDPLCGFKAYSVRVYQSVGYFDRIGSIGTQLMFTASKMGYKITQRDIALHPRADTSRFGRRIIGNWKILKACVKILFLGEAHNENNTARRSSNR